MANKIKTPNKKSVIKLARYFLLANIVLMTLHQLFLDKALPDWMYFLLFLIIGINIGAIIHEKENNKNLTLM